ncbi:hypothetical protein GMSM_20930 [Geomonas sp. Red276]
MAKVIKFEANGRLSGKAFHALDLEEKRRYLATRGAKEKMELIVSDPDAKRLAASFEPQEFYWLVKEIGESDAVELLELASPEQSVFFFDLETWDGYDFSEDKACEWLAHFLEGGEARVHQLLNRLDFEFLQLFLSRELIVGGGIGDQSNDEERLAEYDHTFDGVFMLTFKNPEHSQLIGAFVSMLIKLDNPLYTALMEGIKGDVDLELEESCLRFRTGRLEDLGFPPFEEAISIYARVNPANFQLEGDKDLSLSAEEGAVIPLPPQDETLFFRALGIAERPALVQELNYLVNSALVAEGEAMRDPEAMGDIARRTCGYLNIALESLCGTDETKAAGILRNEHLKHLFQLGFSIVYQLHFEAEKIKATDPATEKLLEGILARRPRYYRALDPDAVDAYREFRDLGDVKRAADLLAELAG